MIIVVFRARLRPDADLAALGRVGERMAELAKSVPGLISYKDYTAEDGENVTVVEFNSEPELIAWREHPEHGQAQERARREFFADYRIQVCRVERSYHFTLGEGRSVETRRSRGSAVHQSRQPPRQTLSARPAGATSDRSTALRSTRKAGPHGGQAREHVGELHHLLRHRPARRAIAVERGVVARQRLCSASARLIASSMPTFMPWPPAGLCTCAASPASSTRPAR